MPPAHALVGRGDDADPAPTPPPLADQSAQPAVVLEELVVVVVVVVVVVDVVLDVVLDVVVVVAPQVGGQHGVGRVGRVKQTQPFCCCSEYSVAVQVSRNGLQRVLSTQAVLVASSTQVETPPVRPQV